MSSGERVDAPSCSRERGTGGYRSESDRRTEEQVEEALVVRLDSWREGEGRT